MNIFLLLSSFFYCSWNYRFDSTNNHFNIVYPDKNAVYLGMIVPLGTEQITIRSAELLNKTPLPIHPTAKYFSIQIYSVGDLVAPAYYFKDVDLMTTSEVMDKTSRYEISLALDPSRSYFALFRIYDTLIKIKHPDFVYYWSGLPPTTIINSIEYSLCDIDYSQQGNIYTNVTKDVDTGTGTICFKNDVFMFMEAPPGSLMNADANYMIACIQPNTHYTVIIKVPKIMCSIGYGEDDPHPWLNETHDLRYASLSVVSTTAPRPTIDTRELPCDATVYTTHIYVNDSTPMPGLLYRQLLPNPHFRESIENAKKTCYDFLYDVNCIKISMGHYYPVLVKHN